jgi:hypothetical protein
MFPGMISSILRYLFFDGFLRILRSTNGAVLITLLEIFFNISPPHIFNILSFHAQNVNYNLLKLDNLQQELIIKRDKVLLKQILAKTCSKTAG